MEPHEYHIKVISPSARVTLKYRTEEDGIEALCRAFEFGGFNEAFQGDCCLEVYSVKDTVPKLEQLYYSEQITQKHMNGLRSTAMW